MRSLLAAIGLGLSISPLAAADLSVPTETIAVAVADSPFTWSGLYFGAQAGYGWGRTEHSYDNGAPSGTSDIGGPVGGVYAGYNAQVGKYVLGVEGDIGLADVIGNYQSDRGATSAGSAKLEWDASLRARFGATFGRSMVYATGGVAFGRYDFKGGPNWGNRICCGYSETLTGWTIGAGVEHAFTDHLITRLEYRYTDYGSASGTLDPAFSWTTMKTASTTSVIQAGIAYKF